MFEVWATLQHRGVAGLHVLTPGFSLREAGAVFAVCDVRQTGARRAPDRSKMLERISGHAGVGQRDFNMDLRLLYTLWPIVDGRKLRHRLLETWHFGSAMTRCMHRWMDAYIDWLNISSSHPGYRAFVFVGPPGSAKSTVVAGLATLPAAARHGIAPHACHMATHGDCRSLSAIEMFKAFAWQLAHSVPEIQNYLVHIEAAKVDKLTSPDAAFTLLIRGPISRLARDARVPPTGIIFCVDGLEEADSPGGLENPLLMCLREMFPTLPMFCRLVATVRPEPDCGHVVRSLRA
eukprot:192491-Chlamydomonas_euryale.AAC.1